MVQQGSCAIACPCSAYLLCPALRLPLLPPDLGHQLMAELLAGVVLTAVKNVAEGGGPAVAAPAAGQAEGPAAAGGSGQGMGVGVDLPPPMIPGNADVPTSLCAMQVRAAASQPLQGDVLAC